MYQTILTIAKSIDNNATLVEHHNQHTIVLAQKESVLPLLNNLKTNSDTAFDMLIDITAID
jgi:NADH:ubiquinone oxidoreductase subunit C